MFLAGLTWSVPSGQPCGTGSLERLPHCPPSAGVDPFSKRTPYHPALDIKGPRVRARRRELFYRGGMPEVGGKEQGSIPRRRLFFNQCLYEGSSERGGRFGRRLFLPHEEEHHAGETCSHLNKQVRPSTPEYQAVMLLYIAGHRTCPFPTSLGYHLMPRAPSHFAHGKGGPAGFCPMGPCHERLR